MRSGPCSRRSKGGPNIPDSMKVGDKLRIKATVEEYEPNTCLFLLDPVSTEYR